MKCSVYIATSADGFIARPDGDISWLVRPEYREASDIGLVYETFVATVDAIVMGRHTYEKVITFDEWYYEGLEVVVLSSSGELNVPDSLRGKVRQLSGSPEEILDVLTKEGKRHLYIDGGVTIQRFLERGLIDELIITTIPILLGDGIPLFRPGSREQPLELLAVDSSETGPVQVRYRVITSEDVV